MLVSEQTRQFYAYKDIADRFLPHVFGAFRAATEEHLPLTLINDWDVTADGLAGYAVLVLANAAALSDRRSRRCATYVRGGGGLVATGRRRCATNSAGRGAISPWRTCSACRTRAGPRARERPNLDENFAIALDDNYWKQRQGVATLTWTDHDLAQDAKLRQLVPEQSRHLPRAAGQRQRTERPPPRWRRDAAGGLGKAALARRRAAKIRQGPIVYLAAAAGRRAVELRLPVPAPPAGQARSGPPRSRAPFASTLHVRASDVFHPAGQGGPPASLSTCSMA